MNEHESRNTYAEFIGFRKTLRIVVIAALVTGIALLVTSFFFGRRSVT